MWGVLGFTELCFETLQWEKRYTSWRRLVWDIQDTIQFYNNEPKRWRTEQNNIRYNTNENKRYSAGQRELQPLGLEIQNCKNYMKYNTVTRVTELNGSQHGTEKKDTKQYRNWEYSLDSNNIKYSKRNRIGQRETRCNAVKDLREWWTRLRDQFCNRNKRHITGQVKTRCNKVIIIKSFSESNKTRLGNGTKKKQNIKERSRHNTVM